MPTGRSVVSEFLSGWHCIQIIDRSRFLASPPKTKLAFLFTRSHACANAEDQRQLPQRTKKVISSLQVSGINTPRCRLMFVLAPQKYFDRRKQCALAGILQPHRQISMRVGMARRYDAEVSLTLPAPLV
jgi:hypothetical protein